MSKKKKKARGPSRAGRRPSAGRLDDQLQQVSTLIEQEQWVLAREILETLDRQYPQRLEVVSDLAYVCHRLNDYPAHLAACQRLVALAPGSAEAALMLAGAYLFNGRPFLAQQAFQRFLKRWPDHDRAEEIRQEIARLQEQTEDILSGMGLSGDAGRQIAAWHEEVQGHLGEGKYQKARQVAEQLLRQKPDFVPALNNCAEAWFREGHPDQAIATQQRALALQPDNVHAQSNLARYLCLSGKLEEARTAVEKLRTMPSTMPDRWIKKAEAFSLLGDDQAVLDVLRAAEQEAEAGDPLHEAYLYHLAAVAACRLGREDEAHGYWKDSLKRLPGFGLARENLDDLDNPVGQRHAPWPFEIFHWINPRTVEHLAAQIKPGAKEEAATQGARRFVQAHPEMNALVPMLLDRGDPKGREFALRLALMAQTPELLAGLRDFGLGQRGPDPMRIQAAEAAADGGLIPSGPVQMWTNGESREVLLLGFEVHEEQTRAHSPRVEELARQAVEALHEDDAVKAEQILREGLADEPESPDLLNYLAQAFTIQGRTREAEDLTRDIHRRFPDYFFGRANLARILVNEGKLDEAQQLIQPLLLLKRLHRTEFAALCMAEVELLMARGLREGALTWLDLWERLDPEHPMLEPARDRILRPSWKQRLGSWLSSRQRRQ